MSKFYGKMFASRVLLSFIMVMILLMTCILRVAVIATGNYNTVQANQSSYKINVARLRGTIYDCNMVPLTNSSKKIVAAVLPTPKGIMAASAALEGDALKNVLETLKNNKPAICTVDDKIASEGVATTTVYSHNGEYLPACHIIGYIDATGHGVSGLELAYDDLLYSDKSVSAVFTSDGKGNVLEGIEPYFENDLSVVHSGVVTTLDINIQSVTERALSKLSSGCAIVAEAQSGKIRAMASVPTFDVNNLELSLSGENSPMINKALAAFNVGSIFKPIVAAAAIENGYINQTYNCTGSTEIADRTFRCHKLDGHGEMNMCTALSQSCNCYFFKLATVIGSEKLYKASANLSLSGKIRIADNLFSASGNMPTEKALENEGAIANFSIGQGTLLASPVAMLNLYSAIATNGCYIMPSIVEKTIKDGAEQSFDKRYPTRVMNVETAAILRDYLKNVITEGTGSEAAPQNCDAAGKTATAQTGRYYDNGEEITNSWFCGFFPADAPKYVVVVMSNSRLSVSTASIFAEISDEIMQIENQNVEFDD